jgi:transcription initiation factor TFIIA large subunit
MKAEATPYNVPQQAPIPQQHVPPMTQGRPVNEAQQRAAQLLQNRFGDRAGQQVASLNGTIAPQAHHNVTYIKEEEDANPYAKRMKTDQTDGVCDERDTWAIEYARRKAMYARDRESSKTMIRDQVAANQQMMEGGGVLMPLDEQPTIGLQAQRKAAKSTQNSSEPSSSLPRAQGDMAADDEDDEDAINSDLDDPDDTALNPDDEEEGGKVMLCTYDKVQRVKNKWKCVLKDGILRLEGHE